MYASQDIDVHQSAQFVWLIVNMIILMMVIIQHRIIETKKTIFIFQIVKITRLNTNIKMKHFISNLENL